jgi:tetrahydrodipicolinate N-succinyltransferase
MVRIMGGIDVIIGHNVTICRSVYIGANAQIGNGVKLGTGCVVHSDLRIPNGVKVKAYTEVTKDNIAELAPGVMKSCSVVVDGKRLYGIDALRAMGRIPEDH